MPVFYIDASALVKQYRTEKGTDVVNALYSGKKDYQARRLAGA